MPALNVKIALDGSGNGIADTIPITGQLAAIRVVKGTANPTVTVAEAGGMTQTILNGVSVTATTNYYPRIEVQDNAGAALVYALTDGVPDRYQLDSPLRVTVAGGDAAGELNVIIQIY